MGNSFNTENNNESLINYDDISDERSQMDIEASPPSLSLNRALPHSEIFDHVKERYPYIINNESLINYDDKSDEISPMDIEVTPPSSSLDRELPHTETFNFVKERYFHINDTTITPIAPNINTEQKNSGTNDKSDPKPLFKVIEIPSLFSENQINQKIKNMDLSEEKKALILMDENSEVAKIKKIKYQLELDSKKRIKGKKISIRTDNLIDGIKTVIISYLLTSINLIIESVYKGDFKQKNKIINSLKSSKIELKNNIIEIKKIEYEWRGKHKSMNDILNFLKKTPKIFFSNNISLRYDHNKIHENYNKIIIETLLEDENNKDLFDFLFNRLTIENWLDIFIYKKELTDIDGYNELKHNQIKDNIVRIEHYLKNNDKIAQNDKNYKIDLHCFLLLIYNLKRYLNLREKRKANLKQDH